MPRQRAFFYLQPNRQRRRSPHRPVGRRQRRRASTGGGSGMLGESIPITNAAGDGPQRRHYGAAATGHAELKAGDNLALRLVLARGKEEGNAALTMGDSESLLLPRRGRRGEGNDGVTPPFYFLSRSTRRGRHRTGFPLLNPGTRRGRIQHPPYVLGFDGEGPATRGGTAPATNSLSEPLSSL